MLFFFIHIGYAGVILLIQILLLYKMHHKRTDQINVTQVTPQNIRMQMPSSRTHNSTHRSSKHSAQSDDNHIVTLQNTQRLHRTLQKKGTFTIESVQETTGRQQRNSVGSQNTTSPSRNLFKTPTLIRKNSGYQIINKRTETQQSAHPLNMPTIPSMQELPDSVRQSEIKFIGEIVHHKNPKEIYYIIYRVLMRTIISQALIGSLLQVNLNYALCGLIDISIVWLLRFTQLNKKWIQILQLILSFGFDITILILFSIDEIWSIAFAVIAVIDTILEIIIIKTQSSRTQDTFQTQQ